LIYKGVRKLNEEEKKVAPELKNIPFQLQITYVDQTGAKALRFVKKICFILFPLKNYLVK